MSDADCASFLSWALPRMGLRARGFRRVRGQVCKRIGRRLTTLSLSDHAAYRQYLSTHPDEWAVLDGLCRVTISRFYRDRAIFDAIRERVLPGLAAGALSRGQSTLRAWSAGSASGEEAYTLALIWNLEVAPRFAPLALEIVATDADPHILERARRARYPGSSLVELPQGWRAVAFDREDERSRCFVLRQEHRQRVSFHCQDIRAAQPDGPFDLLLCRNLVFTYFEEALRARVIEAVLRVLAPGGSLVVGSHETVDAETHGLEPVAGCRGIFGRCGRSGRAEAQYCYGSVTT